MSGNYSSYLNRDLDDQCKVLNGDIALDILGLGTICAYNDLRYKVTKGLLDRFGEKRVIDSPITESGFAGLTVGAALAGLHPVVSTLTYYIMRMSNPLPVRVHDLQLRHASH